MILTGRWISFTRVKKILPWEWILGFLDGKREGESNGEEKRDSISLLRALKFQFCFDLEENKYILK